MNVNEATISVQPEVPVHRAIPPRPDSPREGFTTLAGDEVYCIPAFDAMPPFLMSIVSDSDLWMYVSSAGGLTCGRRVAEDCLFPYETDDRLHHLRGTTGPITLVRDRDTAELWEPFAGPASPSRVQRNLYKSSTGTSVTFEEINPGFGLTFRYTWACCDRFGFVRTATLINHSMHRTRSFELLDGLLNILPAGVQLGTQQSSSCLADAYKVSELDRTTRLGIFSLNSMISDRAEPAECLRATIAWCRGLEPFRVMLSQAQVDQFRLGRALHGETLLRGQRGSYLVNSTVHLKPGQAHSWCIAADVARTQQQVGETIDLLTHEKRPIAIVRDALIVGETNLRRIIAGNDGLQTSGLQNRSVHHFANVLFNTLRGGACADLGAVRRERFTAAVRARSMAASAQHAAWLSALPESMSIDALRQGALESDSPDLARLAHEYLPITFARRHGDPSRPWNRFEIAVRDAHGQPVIAYQGNWRDIFQNWEALALSYPSYLPSLVAKFVNASTADGFNPYRLTDQGIDWEAPEPENPWSNIGYWGDHQIVYLTRLLEWTERFNPGLLASMLARPIYSFANVPYRIAPYESLVRCPRESIEFDKPADRSMRALEAEIGSDARLLRDQHGVIHVSLMEKLLVPILAKLGNFVVGGGIWMNTQRPEWNDANNALAGAGLSVVTLCYLHRKVKWIANLLRTADAKEFGLSGHVAEWLNGTRAALAAEVSLLDGRPVTDADSKRLLDRLGGCFSSYRAKLYRGGLGDRVKVSRDDVLALLHLAEQFAAHTITLNRRDDGLYHAYNLVAFNSDTTEAAVTHLSEMLEGQVAALGCGLLNPKQAVALVDAMYASPLYRADQHSFTLYPDRAPKPFLQKNTLDRAAADAVPLLAKLLATGDRRLVQADGPSRVRFHADLRNERELSGRLTELEHDPLWRSAVEAHRADVLRLYEQTFEHHRFTGRSGSMFGFEGLGCIYWHMVAKLLVAVQECHRDAVQAGAPADVVERLAQCYENVREGLGYNKTARQYGAFPTDPYSHSPAHSGARQPGMTGQVKEEIITRRAELGVRVDASVLSLRPDLLERDEFTAEPSRFTYFDLDGNEAQLDLPAHALAFTICQTPVVYRIAGAPLLKVFRRDGSVVASPEFALSPADSAAVFGRTGLVERIELSLPESMLRSNRKSLPELDL